MASDQPLITAYARVIAERAASVVPAEGDGGPTVNEVVLAFLRHGEAHDRHPDGSPTGELDNDKTAFRMLKPHVRLVFRIESGVSRRVDGGRRSE